MPSLRWQIWIDVGGTFTDCLARSPDGTLHRLKLLSTGIFKGHISEVASRTEFVDRTRIGDAPDFFEGYTLRIFSERGLSVAVTHVEQFDSATGRFSVGDLPKGTTAGWSYELSSGEESPIVAVRYLLKLKRRDPIPPISMRLGTTRGTNALLTRRGAKTAFITTVGFADILRIGYQNRPRLFDLNILKPTPLFAEVIEIVERVSAAGEILTPLARKQARTELAKLKDLGIESLAICLKNAYRNNAHEQILAEIAGELGFTEISISSRVAPLIKMVSRGDTTVVDAYLNPVLRKYVSSIRHQLASGAAAINSAAVGANPSPEQGELRILTSAGSLIDADQFVGKDSILSGPAGGVVGFSAVAKAAGFERAIGFDMGGTSTDVARYDGRFEREFETEKAGVRIVAPMMAIETVAAGGGSICHFDGVKLVVGPDSAGAHPGPACYGRGGPLAVTDVNLMLGKILPEHFPFRLDRRAVEERLEELCATIEAATGTKYSPLALAEGFVRVANANMAKAIRSVSVARGCDPRDYVLVSFGGAGGQHACAVASELGMRQILNHPDAGLLSAFGIGMANIERHQVEGIYQPLSPDTLAELLPIFERMHEAIVREVAAEGIDPERITVEDALDLRYRGFDAALTVPRPDDGDWAAAYARQHESLYGYIHANRPIEIVAARATATGQSGAKLTPAQRVLPHSTPPADDCRDIYFDGRVHAANVYLRRHLQPGHIIYGPAIVAEAFATTVVEPGWRSEVLSDGQLLLTFEHDACDQHAAINTHTADPVLLEIFNNQFAGIAEQMGITLRNTSSSVNVKERLDFSCAIFTPTGQLVVNAPHIPVHLGAMGYTVRRIIADNPSLAAGDVFVTNDPYRGGSHLPDVTVVTPVHNAHGQLLFFTASRAHHAEIGGIRAGSMPPFSKNLAEEGVLIRNFKLVEGGRSHVNELRELLTTATYPTRNIADNLADIAAQVAANRQGARDLLALVERYSLAVVSAYMQHIQSAAEQKMRAAIRRLADGRYEFADHLDDGSRISVAITISGDAATIDFAGTSPVLSGNLNANRAIVTAAVMYVLRCLIDEDIPLNEGVLAPIEIVVPECLLNPAEYDSAEECAAVAGGNVETSQRIVDVLLGALQLAAASQGTMNNLLFGDRTFGYYETIGGGAGATAKSPGADAVHSHMTNTRLTDPEVLELRYPVRVQEFSIRHDSGGGGQNRGGNGIVRSIEFLQPLDVSLLTQRRGPYAPYGLAGGAAGSLGRNTLHHADGGTETLPAQAQFTAQPGDVLTLETPGGGGWGETKCY